MSSLSADSNDFLLAFYLNTAAVQGRFLRFENTLDTILHYHTYPPIIAHLLAETLSVAAVLIAQLKTQARVTLQIKGKGLIKLLVVDTNDKGEIRGYADYDPLLNIAEKEYSFSELMNPGEGSALYGTLIVTFDQGDSGQLFQGVVELRGDSLVESMVHYFKQSVQQDIYLLIQTKRDEQGKWRSATLFLQKNAIIEGEEEEQWAYSKLLAQTIKPEELLNFNQAAHDILINIFHEQEIYFQPCKVMKAHCRCSRERIQNFVDQWTEQEKNELKRNGQLEIRCEFCNTSYNFT